MKKNGISLIILVITIVVIIILAGAVILSLSKNNPIATASTANYKTSGAEYMSELGLVLSQKYAEAASTGTQFNPDLFNATVWDGNTSNTSGTVKQYVSTLRVEDAAKYEIQRGKLVYIGNDANVIANNTDIGILNKTTVDVGVIATTNSTIDGKIESYSNPIIPKGFKAVNTANAVWPTGWNNGLVIEDASGNQFVWVPLIGDTDQVRKSKFQLTTTFDGTITPPSATYTDPCINGYSTEIAEYNTMYTSVIVNGGYYIGRYETGNVSSQPVVKAGATVYNNVPWGPSSKDIGTSGAPYKSRNMYNNDTFGVQSTLVYGAQWDYMITWAQCSANIRQLNTYTATPSLTGAAYVDGTTYDVNKNIYDLVGNVAEWTMENMWNGGRRVIRGGSYFSDYYQPGVITSPSFRYSSYHSYTYLTDPFKGFRIALYIK